MAKKSPPRPPANAKPYLSLVAFDELGRADQVARQIIDARRDLSPSVARIMDAGLDADTTYVAIELFRESLERTSDPHRDPRNAIATASARQREHQPVDGGAAAGEAPAALVADGAVS